MDAAAPGSDRKVSVLKLSKFEQRHRTHQTRALTNKTLLLLLLLLYTFCREQKLSQGLCGEIDWRIASRCLFCPMLTFSNELLIRGAVRSE